MLGLQCCARLSLGGVLGPLTAAASLVWSTGSRCLGFSSCGWRAPERRLSCPSACGIFLDQGWNLCLLNWQVDSLPLSHQGSPRCVSFYSKNTAFPPFPFFHLHHPMYENISPFWCPLSSPEAIYLKNILVFIKRVIR